VTDAQFPVLLRTIEVARRFRVAPRTVQDWARNGKVPSIKTPGGQLRYPLNNQLRAAYQRMWGEPPTW
jgi:excisionase family DNA binding protein